MGCDIHCYVEKRNINGHWYQIEDFESDYYQNYRSNSYFNSEEYRHAESPVGSRNYYMFTVMANVRNYGDNPIPIISEPRDLPDDVSNVIREKSDSWDSDGHSHSWLTVADLLKFDSSNHQLPCQGDVPYKKYLDLKAKGEGKDLNFRDAVRRHYNSSQHRISQETADDEAALIAVIMKHGPEKIFVEAAWKEPLRDLCGTLFKSALEQLKARCESKDFTDVRLVFWFDN